MVLRNHSAGLQINFGDAHAILHEHNVLRTVLQDVQTPLLVPFGRRRFARLCILQKFDCHIAERRGRKITNDERDPTCYESSLAVLQPSRPRWFSFDLVGNPCSAEVHVDVIMAVAVQ